MDRFIKIIRYLPTRVTIDAAELAEEFYSEIVYRYSMPDGIISDRGSVFISSFWLAICFYSKMKRRLSTAFYS